MIKRSSVKLQPWLMVCNLRVEVFWVKKTKVLDFFEIKNQQKTENFFWRMKRERGREGKIKRNENDIKLKTKQNKTKQNRTEIVLILVCLQTFKKEKINK